MTKRPDALRNWSVGVEESDRLVSISATMGRKARRSRKHGKTRRDHSAGFKAKLTLAALEGDQRPASSAQQFDFHRTGLRSRRRGCCNGSGCRGRHTRRCTTASANFCVEVREELILCFRVPEIINSDQGSQFTRSESIDTLQETTMRAGRTAACPTARSHLSVGSHLNRRSNESHSQSYRSMNLRSFDLNLLVVFDAILSEGNLTRAADKIAMSQPALSNALARLRVAVGDPLFIRRAHTMEPTERARKMAVPVRQALDLLSGELQAASTFDCRTAKVAFWVAMEDYGEIVVAPSLMKWLAKSAPGVRVNVCSEKKLAASEEMRRGKIDLTIDYYQVEGAGLEVRRLMTDERVCVSRSDHPLLGEKLTVEAWVALPHVTLNRRISGGGTINRELASVGLQRNVVMEVPHYMSMPGIVQGTDLVCTMPRRVAEALAARFRLKIVELPVRIPPLAIYASWDAGRNGDRGHRWFRDAIIKLASIIETADQYSSNATYL